MDRGKVWPVGFSVKPFSFLPIYLYAALFTANEIIQLLGSDPETVRSGGCPGLIVLSSVIICAGIGLCFLFHPIRPSADRLIHFPGRTIILGALILGTLALHVRSLFLERVSVAGPSMQPTLTENDSFWIRKAGVLDLSFPLSIRIPILSPEIERGQIVVYRYPVEGSCNNPLWIKRIVALPGDRYVFEKGSLLVNGKPESYDQSGNFVFQPPGTEPYPEGYQPPLLAVSPEVRKLGVEALYAAMNGLPRTGIVPENSILVLGDNRSHSRDSRIVGFIPVSYIVGFAINNDSR